MITKMGKEQAEPVDPRFIDIAHNVGSIRENLDRFRREVAPHVAPSPARFGRNEVTEFEHIVKDTGLFGTVEIGEKGHKVSINHLDRPLVNNQPIIELSLSIPDTTNPKSLLSLISGFIEIPVSEPTPHLSLYMNQIGENNAPSLCIPDTTDKRQSFSDFTDLDIKVLGTGTEILNGFLADFLASH